MNAPLRPHIIVAGLARCGTTLTMHMLHAAGIPCIGKRPGFEVEQTDHRTVDPAFLARHPGHAFKLLDPHHCPLPAGLPGVLIWLDRNPVEQAKSQAKFAHLMLGVRPANRAILRRWSAALRVDRARALAPFADWPTLILDFERIILRPQITAERIARHLEPWWPDLDIRGMAQQVRPRSPACAPGLEIELALTAEADAFERTIPTSMALEGQPK